MSCSRRRWLGIVEQRQHPARQQVSRGISARVDQQHEEQAVFRRRQPVAVDFGIQELRGEVGAGMFALVIRHAHRVVEHLHRGDGPFVHGHRFVGRMHLLGQFVQMAAILQRDTHQIGDNVGRQFARDIADQVAFAARDYPVDDLARQLLDPGPQRLRGARFEFLAHQHAVARMLRRVHHQHHVARRPPATPRRCRRSLSRRHRTNRSWDRGQSRARRGSVLRPRIRAPGARDANARGRDAGASGIARGAGPGRMTRR